MTGEGSLIRNSIENDRIFSMILWGPPGCGKTTLATIIANETRSHFSQISAVLSGVKQIREVIEEARKQLTLYRKRTLLFVDEIHRFNKSQQDAFLQHVESGLITLIGATTENPSFEVIPALLSRCRVVTLSAISRESMVDILERASEDPDRGLGKTGAVFESDALEYIAAISDGDVRTALNALEIAAFQHRVRPGSEGENPKVSVEDLEKVLQKKALLYDKSGDEHFNLISAFHKSLRGSDPDAAIYWIARMLGSGEDPFYIIRRMVTVASEDIGVADPNALRVALDAMEAFRFLGYPEGERALVQAAVYLATAPKSNSIYTAYAAAKEEVKRSGALPVPLHIRNAPTKLMEGLGYKKGYKYAHDYTGGYAAQEHLPEDLQDTRFYFPTERGYEKIVKSRLEGWLDIKKKTRKS